LVTYDPTIFDAALDAATAMDSGQPGWCVHTSEERCEIKTDYLIEIVDAYLPPRDATALDSAAGLAGSRNH
jgi:hypothetical protein